MVDTLEDPDPMMLNAEMEEDYQNRSHQIIGTKEDSFSGSRQARKQSHVPSNKAPSQRLEMASQSPAPSGHS